jgi:hypothetical protein
MKSFFQRGGKKPSAGGRGAAKATSAGERRAAERKKEDRGPSIDDLIILERYGEAEERLRKRLRTSPTDQHARMKLANVLEKLRQPDEAVVEYTSVADQFLRDGFFDRAHATLLRGQRIAPANDGLSQRLVYLEERRKLDRVRRQAVSALSSASRGTTGTVATAAIELEQIWDRLSRTDFVRNLPGDQIVKVLSNMGLRRFGEGDILVRADATEAMIFLVTFGELEALAPVPQAGGRPTSLRTFSIGDLLGESTLLEHKQWPVSLRASTPGSVLAMDRSGLEGCLLGNPDPRGLLSALRSQGLDALLRDMCAKLGVHSGPSIE